jgi:septum formation protein
MPTARVVIIWSSRGQIGLNDDVWYYDYGNRGGKISARGSHLISWNIILASQSKWRLQMLLDLGVTVTAQSSNVDESKHDAETAPELALLLAEKKAEAVWERNRDCLVIGSDQVAFTEIETFGKPQDDDAHFKRLCGLRGNAHSLVTAVVILYPSSVEGGLTPEKISFSETTVVHFRGDVSDEEIWQYVRSGEASGCAGGYMVERKGAWLIDHIEGDYFNVVGLPLFAVIKALRTLGMRLD